MKRRGRGDITRQRAREYIRAGGGLRPQEIQDWYDQVTKIRNAKQWEKTWAR